jgi:hypothetical protein
VGGAALCSAARPVPLSREIDLHFCSPRAFLRSPRGRQNPLQKRMLARAGGFGKGALNEVVPRAVLGSENSFDAAPFRRMQRFRNCTCLLEFVNHPRLMFSYNLP